jgi:CRISPR/Cas system-associated exonuclease Cas4 (RecB family)
MSTAFERAISDIPNWIDNRILHSRIAIDFINKQEKELELQKELIDVKIKLLKRRRVILRVIEKLWAKRKENSDESLANSIDAMYKRLNDPVEIAKNKDGSSEQTTINRLEGELQDISAEIIKLNSLLQRKDEVHLPTPARSSDSCARNLLDKK